MQLACLPLLYLAVVGSVFNGDVCGGRNVWAAGRTRFAIEAPKTFCDVFVLGVRGRITKDEASRAELPAGNSCHGL